MGLRLMPCSRPETCLPERKRALYSYHYIAYASPCMNCPVGAARQLETFEPEPGFGPYCIVCGGKLPTRHKGKSVVTRSGVCYECAHRGRTNKGNRTNHSGKAYWGYKEMAHKIATKKEKTA